MFLEIFNMFCNIFKLLAIDQQNYMMLQFYGVKCIYCMLNSTKIVKNQYN